MEVVGIFATIGLTTGGIIAVVCFTTWILETLKSLKERVTELEIPGDITDEEIESVRTSTTKEEALDAIIALRSK